jgi:glucose/arabinose dehydrogenase
MTRRRRTDRLRDNDPMRRHLAPATVAIAITLAVITASCGSSINPGNFANPVVEDPTSAAPTEVIEPTSAPVPTSRPPAPSPNAAEPETAASTPEAVPTSTPVPAPSSNEVELPQEVAVKLTPVLEIRRPIALAARAGSDSIFIATREGRIVEVSITGDAGTIETELIDIGSRLTLGGEEGLLGLTFSPDGDELYVNLTDLNGDTNIIGWDMAGATVDVTTERILLVVDQPADNHNGGEITFGPDGLLYIGLGDGGGSSDQFPTGQDPNSLLATVIRINPTADGYEIPADNPFANGGGEPEIYIWGARNPWRFSFDQLTGDLWVADVGQGAIEEVNVFYASEGGGRGANLGWSNVEGSAPFNAGEPPTQHYVAPLYEYTHGEGCSVTGGYIYRGTAVPALIGHYIFGDYCTANLWGIASSETQGLLGRFDLGVRVRSEGLVSFGQGPDGELYVLSFEDVIFRLDPA